MVLSDSAIAALAAKHWPQSEWVTAVAVCLAETDGDFSAVNRNAKTGDMSVGGWQVNYYGSLREERVEKYGPPEELKDPERNAAAAFDIWEEAGRSWRPWGGYNRGGYKRYGRYERAQKAVKELMASWRLPPALKALVSEANQVAPFRSKASDGSIGDASHQARKSDHNIDWDDPQHDINAVDITHDPAHGWDCQVRAPQVVEDPRTQYVIFDRHIITGRHANGPQPGVPRPYKGSNTHEKHMHVSLKHDEAVEEDTSPWLPEFKEDWLAALTEDQQKKLYNRVKKLDGIATMLHNIKNLSGVAEVGRVLADVVARLERIEAKVGA